MSWAAAGSLLSAAATAISAPSPWNVATLSVLVFIFGFACCCCGLAWGCLLGLLTARYSPQEAGQLSVAALQAAVRLASQSAVRAVGGTVGAGAVERLRTYRVN